MRWFDHHSPKLILIFIVSAYLLAGGLYAVTRCEVRGDAYDIIPATWKQLMAWCEDSKYRSGTHQWLEELLTLPGSTEEFTLNLYLPIADTAV